MPRPSACAWILFVVSSVVSLVAAQTVEKPEGRPDSNHLAQLENCREGIVDPLARPEDLRRWIDTLLAFDTPEAHQLVVELLDLAENPDVQKAMCRGVAGLARTAPHRLVVDFVDPLLHLLGAEREDLRAAAVQALIDCPGAQVPTKLRTIAAQSEAPMEKRLAAIDALASKVEHREVIGELVTLLDAGVPAITERALTALEPLSDEKFGSDVVRWRQWWAQKSQLSEKAWLADQLQMYRDRDRALAREFNVFREEAGRRHDAITARLGDFQREVFRPLSAEEKEAKLAAWLGDPLPEVRRTALAVIRARIADEGRRPVGAVLDVVLWLLREGSAPIRREVLTIVQTLKDPAVVDAVLDQLQREEDPATRLAILKAIGRLNDPRAIPNLIAEIESADSSRECIRETAIALGQIAGGMEDRSEATAALPALKSRYQMVPTDDVPLRAALLTAMAGVADPSFAPELLEAVEWDDANLLRPAIRGLQAIQDTSKLPRLRSLTAHADPLVRRTAAEAVGELGSEDADVESVLTRLNPSIEANEAVRNASWGAFRTLVATKPIEERVQSAERLREMPDLEARYLIELAEGLSTANATDAGVEETVYDRLSTILVAQGNHGEAASYLRELYELCGGRGNDAGATVGLRWLEAALRAPGPARAGEVVVKLATEADEDARGQIIGAVAAYFDELVTVADSDRVGMLLDDLKTVPPDALGEAWTQLLSEMESRLGNDTAPPAPDSPP